MINLNARGLAETFADERLLKPEQYEEFTRTMLPMCRDVRILAKEVVYRGWLTPFQIEQILANRAESLILGSYVLLEQLGEGGMGRVFRARHWKLNRIVAVKLINGELARHPSAVARFEREIHVLAKIHHPNIVQALDADFQLGTIYFAMEFFDGTDLCRYVNHHGPLQIAEACTYVRQVAGALQHAHELGLIHRDIKPSNILLTEPAHTIKLLDLGLSRCEIPDNDSLFNELTRAGALIGTPDFMSPEQVQDSRSADIRSDLYSLGCTFYYLLAGRAPFEYLDATVDKLYAQCETGPTPIEQLRPDVPSEIAVLIRKLMAKRRRDRFQAPSEFIAALDAARNSADSAPIGTLLEANSITLADVPLLPFARESARTVNLSPSEIGLVAAPEDGAIEERREPRSVRLFKAAHFVIAVLIAGFALVVMWQADLGPGGRGGRQGTISPVRSTPMPDDNAAGGAGNRSAPVGNAAEQSGAKSDGNLPETEVKVEKRAGGKGF